MSFVNRFKPSGFSRSDRNDNWRSKASGDLKREAKTEVLQVAKPKLENIAIEFKPREVKTDHNEPMNYVHFDNNDTSETATAVTGLVDALEANIWQPVVCLNKWMTMEVIKDYNKFIPTENDIRPESLEKWKEDEELQSNLKQTRELCAEFVRVIEKEQQKLRREKTYGNSETRHYNFNFWSTLMSFMVEHLLPIAYANEADSSLHRAYYSKNTKLVAVTKRWDYASSLKKEVAPVVPEEHDFFTKTFVLMKHSWAHTHIKKPQCTVDENDVYRKHDLAFLRDEFVDSASKACLNLDTLSAIGDFLDTVRTEMRDYNPRSKKPSVYFANISKMTKDERAKVQKVTDVLKDVIFNIRGTSLVQNKQRLLSDLKPPVMMFFIMMRNTSMMGSIVYNALFNFDKTYNTGPELMTIKANIRPDVEKTQSNLRSACARMEEVLAKQVMLCKNVDTSDVRRKLAYMMQVYKSCRDTHHKYLIYGRKYALITAMFSKLQVDSNMLLPAFLKGTREVCTFYFNYLQDMKADEKILLHNIQFPRDIGSSRTHTTLERMFFALFTRIVQSFNYKGAQFNRKQTVELLDFLSAYVATFFRPQDLDLDKAFPDYAQAVKSNRTIHGNCEDFMLMLEQDGLNLSRTPISLDAMSAIDAIFNERFDVFFELCRGRMFPSFFRAVLPYLFGASMASFSHDFATFQVSMRPSGDRLYLEEKELTEFEKPLVKKTLELVMSEPKNIQIRPIESCADMNKQIVQLFKGMYLTFAQKSTFAYKFIEDDPTIDALPEMLDGIDFKHAESATEEKSAPLTQSQKDKAIWTPPSFRQDIPDEPRWERREMSAAKPKPKSII
jgi:hypothetical protein